MTTDVEITQSWPTTEDEVIEQFIKPALLVLGSNYVNDRGELTVAGNVWAKSHAQYMLWLMDQIDDKSRVTDNSERLYFNLFLTQAEGTYVDLLADEYDTTRLQERKAILTQQFTRANSTTEETLSAGFEVQALVDDELYTYTLLDDVVFSVGDLVKSGSVEAEAVGSKYNLAAGAVTIMSEPGNITETTNTGVSQTGREKESDASLVERAKGNFRARGYAQNDFYTSVLNLVTGYPADEECYFFDNTVRAVYGGGHFTIYIMQPDGGGIPAQSVVDECNLKVGAKEAFEARSLDVPSNLEKKHGKGDFPYCLPIPTMTIDWDVKVLKNPSSTKSDTDLEEEIKDIIKYMRRENSLYANQSFVPKFTPGKTYYQNIITGIISQIVRDDVLNIDIGAMNVWAVNGELTLGLEFPETSDIIVTILHAS